MKLKNVSLRTAVILPIVVIMLAILTMFVVFNARDYDFLAQEQGTRILEALYQNTEQRLRALLLEPQRVAKIYGDYISRQELYDYDDLSDVEVYTLEFMAKLRDDLPQISVMAFGDEVGNYIGIRANDDSSLDLMLKDSRTNYDLNIYAGDTVDSELLAGYEGYDPRIRPWYAPVKEEPAVQWSEVYVNYDEKMELTISSLVPVFDDNNGFRGVAGFDVKLSMINEFLISEKIKGDGVIYIIDEDWNILAHSLEEDFVKVIEGDPPSAVLLQATEAENEMVRLSADHIISSKISFGDVEQIMIGNERHYSMYSPLKDPEGLNWSIVVVIPETDLMGAVKERQSTTLRITSVMLLLSMIIAMYLLSKITKPILLSSEAALKLSKGDFESRLDIEGLPLYETRELVSAFNNMSDNLKDSFNRIKLSEAKYRSLVENVDDMIYSVSRDGTFISMNYSFDHALEIESGSLIGKRFTEIFTREDSYKLWTKRFNEVIESKEKQHFQFDFLDQNDVRRVLTVKLIPQLNEYGEVETILGTNTDITELVMAQEEIERLLQAEKEELESLVQQRTAELETTMQELIDRERLASLGSLVAGIAHEINTPLGVAVTAGSYMEKINRKTFEKLREGKISKQSLIDYITSMEESSDIINTNLYRASELIRSFKEISVNQSIEAISDFMVADYIKDVMLALKHEYKNTQHEFEIACDETLEIRSYPGAFSQILTNMIMNSLIHGFEGVDKGHIRIRATREAEDLILEYEDDGVGISKENKVRIFDPFFTTNRKRGGSGLGLNIVYNIVTGKLNGKISCESEQGIGTKFIIRIPLSNQGKS